MNTAVYLESSAWVKRYVSETGSEVVHALIEYAQAQSQVFVASAWLGLAEVTAVLHRLSRRREINRAALARLAHQLTIDCERIRLLSLTEAEWATVPELVARHHLTAADAVHLQAALSWQVATGVGSLVFIGADRQLLRAASREGLTALDIETSDWARLQALL